jgi:lipopolysaccharide export LptBFGC system permease protein LptF
MVATYARYTFLAACAILAVALTIDLTLFLSKVLSALSPQHGSWNALYLARYLILRSTDFLAELLPLIAFIGVFWAEISHTYARERLVVWFSGRTPLQCLLPALIFGLLVGSTQLVLNLYLRPAAVTAMAQDRLGSYGERFDPRPILYPQWFAVGRDVIQAVIEPGEPPSLRDVRIFRMNEALSLQTLFRAKSARPAGRNEWLLIEGYGWSPPRDAGGQAPAGGADDPDLTGTKTSFRQKAIHLPLSPSWLNHRRINARYLRHEVFSVLQKEQFSPSSEFRTWEQARWSLTAFGLALTLLAASLSQLFLATRIELWRLAVIAGCGYVANTFMKVSILLGEHGQLHAAVAAWFVPIFVLCVCVMSARANRIG